MTNYDILQEYEAHKTPVPSYEEYKRLKEVERKKGKLVNVNYKIKQENQQLKELLYSLKCCLTSENIEPQIRVEKSLAKIEEFLTDGK